MEKRIKKSAVWKHRKPPHQIGKNGFGVLDIKKDIDGWVDAKIYRPFPYDLVHMKTETKTKSGWWTGLKWEGLRLKADDKVKYWKQV